jgi:autotransporter strand-loop-strand O-heptosyltransferase
MASDAGLLSWQSWSSSSEEERTVWRGTIAGFPMRSCVLLSDLKPKAELVSATDVVPVAPTVTSPAPSPSAVAQERHAYPLPAATPTQTGPHGILYDFNMGVCVDVPAGSWRVQLRDLDTGNILFETDKDGVFVSSAKRYFIRFGIEAWKDGVSVFRHEYDAAGREVLVQFPVGTLGDIMGWFPYAVRFQEQHGCKLSCAMSELLIPLFRDAYPHITFLTHEEVKAERFYATYSIGLFFEDADCVWQPCDFRLVGLHRTAGYILGVDPEEFPPAIVLEDASRPIAEPYVCIAVQSSTQSKYWNNPAGWHEVVKFLKEHGYRVICIDQKPVHGTGLVWNHIPHGVEDQTGDQKLAERARWLKHADFFVGLSSGLAWAADTPVVMISGFTHPTNEFTSPYRVINYHACNGCWNDVRHRFDHHDFLWCPRHAGTPRQFECTRLITPEHVKAAIRRIPGFGDPSRFTATVATASPRAFEEILP